MQHDVNLARWLSPNNMSGKLTTVTQRSLLAVADRPSVDASSFDLTAQGYYDANPLSLRPERKPRRACWGIGFTANTNKPCLRESHSCFGFEGEIGDERNFGYLRVI